MKKMMYYNMRVRMAQRTLADVRLSLTTRQTAMQEIPEESLRALSSSIKNVRRAAAQSTRPVSREAC